MMKRRSSVKGMGAAVCAATAAIAAAGAAEAKQAPPNILFCLSDDQSWPHAGAYGDKVVKTPTFDRVARDGVLFNYAYCASPSCTPSRSAILTGQHIWQLGQGAQLFGTLPVEHPVYTNLLADSGYHVGCMAKGWAPGNATAGGHKHNPAGKKSYKSFKSFLDSARPGQPWCFWFGSRDPHRGYRRGSGIASGMDLSKVVVPAVFPDTPEVRSDICDYYWEIQRFDRDVGGMIKLVEDAGQMENTIVVITSDNGMPFPRGKATLYDLGVRMPLAICWKGKVPGGRTVDDFVSLTDLAPTFLGAAGIATPGCMTGRSLLGILRSPKSGRVEPDRDCVFTARERHAWCRIDGKGYPSRMIRTRDFLYVRNYEPDRWPSGIYRMVTNEGHYGDVDASPTKDYMLKHRTAGRGRELFELAFGKRPAEELYDCRKDPYQTRNLADGPAHAQVKRRLSARLTAYLKETGDPRETAGKVSWDDWPYYGHNKWKILPER
ncbi:MAG: sulfatase-like hydrolase/transferase [Planctomycetota bacterium]|jgi:arylsulfatase A-like enzyme